MQRIIISLLLIIGLVAAAWFARGRLQNKGNHRQQASKRQAVVERDDGFVGTDTCFECHSEKRDSYLKSGHARTFAEAIDLPVHIVEKFTQGGFYDEERNLSFEYSIDDESLKPKLLAAIRGRSDLGSVPLQLAFGSGDHAITFLSLMNHPTKNRFGFEHRVSWYQHNQSLALTPGHEEEVSESSLEQYGKLEEAASLSRCVSCHTTAAEIDGTRIRNLLPNVGCESCHGAGAIHVAAAREDKSGPPMRLSSSVWTAAAELEVCSECHRAAHQMPEDVIDPDSEILPRFQPVGLTQSACFKGSEELACSTCHNPHEHASQTTRQQYLSKCVECHDQAANETLCPIAPKPLQNQPTPGKDDCVDCHMTPVEVQSGIFFHDHWIRVRGKSD